MRSIVLGRRLAVAVAFGIVALGATRAAAQDMARLRRGQTLLARDCGHCHSVGRAGDSRQPQAPPFRTLGKRYPVESLEEALGEGIISGHPAMPEFKFSGDDVGAIIAYLKSIQRR